MDKVAFVDTQTHPSAKSKLHAKIRTEYGVEWPCLNWSELRKPVYNALAARAKLYITGIPTSCLNPIPEDIPGQAKHWKDCYNSVKGSGTEQRFINEVAVMPDLP